MRIPTNQATNQDLARGAMQFLMRVDLKGSEVPSFGAVCNMIDGIANGALVVQPAAAETPAGEEPAGAAAGAS